MSHLLSGWLLGRKPTTLLSQAASPPLTSLSIGAMGDSNLDAYRGTDNRGGTYASGTYNAIEMMTRVLGTGTINIGVWGAYAEVRRTDFAQNWARTAVTAGNSSNGGGNSFIDNGQHTSLAAQVGSGTVNAVICWIGTNDYAFFNNTYLTVYNGSVAGATLTAKEDSIINNISSAISTIQAAGDPKIVLFNLRDPGPWVTGAFPSAAFRQRVTDSISRVNVRINTLIASVNNVALADWANFDTYLLQAYAGVPFDYYEIGGQTIDMNGANNAPNFMVMADNHLGTITCGIIANMMIIDVLNASLNCSIPRLTDAQILAQAWL